MKERFSVTEWKQLQRLPIFMFQFVALADQELQPEEAHAFTEELADALAYKDPLHSELFADLMRGNNFSEAFDATNSIASDSAQAIEREFASTRIVLEEKLTSDEYNRFFVSMTGTGVKVAMAAGKRRKPFSPEEQQALAIFMMKFNVDMEAGQKALAKL